MNEFREVVAEFSLFFSRLKEECDAVDRKFQSIECRTAFVKEKEKQGVYGAISNYFAKVWDLVKDYPNDDPCFLSCRDHLHQMIHRYICAGGLNNMVVDKPLGHAGDYLTIYHYFLDYSGEQTYEILINQYSRSIPVAVAHRNRIPLLMKEIEAQSRNGGDIMSIGCGPAIELQRASCEPYFKGCNFTLFDVDERALDFVEAKLPENISNVESFNSSVLGLLKLLARRKDQGRQQDFIYCCGLYDYLGDRLAGLLLQSFYDNLKPGGKIMVTNVSSDVGDRGYFEFFAGWDLILRSDHDMLALARHCPAEAKCRVERDPDTGANLYLYLERQ
ncbi:MAG: class I SAM-dependent methyltransferase [Proteobacteria bacterium]|nr:class I SAM-dependent methyltransferase [Pseudomonadota bacterium]MBU1716944.1 class I SAM-dependent methyltransferase [Pseudomonadota bacterium]